MNSEVWKVVDFNLGYEVSNMGNLRSMDRFITNSLNITRFYKGKDIKYKPDKNGYFIYKFLIEGKYKHYKIHRLIAETFIPNPNNLPQVNYKDGDKTNNRINNLEWITNRNNLIHAIKTGLRKYHNRPIVQIDFVTKTPLKIWASKADASLILDVSDWEIWKCLNKQKEQFKNYIWEYI